MKHTVIYIDGMTCINCQSRIWNVLKLRPEITGITVSYEYSRAEFDYDPKKIGMKEIVKMIEDLGYQVIPAEQFRRKQLRQAAAEIFAIALLFVILQRFGILNHLAPDSLAETGMGYGMLFVIGLITSVHCIAMCGGINLSQTLQKQEANAEEISRSMFRNTFSYNMGRVVSYTVIGGFLGAVGGLAGIGDSLQASTVFQGSLKLLAGIIMVVMGVNMLGIFPGLRKLGSRSFFHVLLQSGNGSSDAWIWLNFFCTGKEIYQTDPENRSDPGGCYGTCHDVSGKRAVRFGKQVRRKGSSRSG